MQLDINRKNNDPFARYKMPSVILAHHGKTKTMFRNLADVCHNLHRSPNLVLKYLSYTLGTSIQSADEYVLKGIIPVSKAQDAVYKFIDDFVLCGECTNPETKFQKYKNGISLKCYACGSTTSLDKKSKIYSVIEKEKSSFEEHKKYVGEDLRVMEDYKENIDFNGNENQEDDENIKDIDELDKIEKTELIKMIDEENKEGILKHFNDSTNKEGILVFLIQNIDFQNQSSKIQIISKITDSNKNLCKDVLSCLEYALVSINNEDSVKEYLKVMINNDVFNKIECSEYFQQKSKSIDACKSSKIRGILKDYF